MSLAASTFPSCGRRVKIDDRALPRDVSALRQTSRPAEADGIQSSAPPRQRRRGIVSCPPRSEARQAPVDARDRHECCTR